ncbi:MAG: VPLPA-CTERM sorting domain-containing protein [Nitrospira sp.]|nr:VPLPA-CTERM sorting domain-containing protein [Nitrospira sp.]
MKSMNRMKKAVLALTGAAVMVTGGLSQQAQAFNFQQGDLVLAIYGNRTAGEGAEAIINLTDFTGTNSGPSMATLASNPGTTFTFDLLSYLNAAGIFDTNPANPQYPVRYTVVGIQPDASTGGSSIIAGSATNRAGSVESAIGNAQTGLSNYINGATDANSPNLIPGQNGAILPFNNANSFSQRTGTAERIFGSFNLPMAANLDQLLYIVKGDTELIDDPLLARGQAMLSANGLFQITGGQLAAIPVPAAVVLFGSGLIGLAGMARRNLFRQAA